MAESMIASGKRDRDDLGLASTEDLGHEPGAQRLRVAEEFGECPPSALHDTRLYAAVMHKEARLDVRK